MTDPRDSTKQLIADAEELAGKSGKQAVPQSTRELVSETERMLGRERDVTKKGGSAVTPTVAVGIFVAILVAALVAFLLAGS